MPIETSELPFSPVLFLATVSYLALSATVTGPEIISRELENSGWHATCQSDLIADIETGRAPQQSLPNVPHVGDLICSVYPELNDLCRMIPDPNAAARETQRRIQAAEDARIRRAASKTGSACSCAQETYTAAERYSIAVYAASGRLITPPAVKNRETGLSTALRSPACKMEG